MNFVIDPYSITNEDIVQNVRFLEKKQNIIMQGEFTKIMYSLDVFTMNGIYLSCPLVCMDTARKLGTNTAVKSYNKHMIWYHPNSPANVDVVRCFDQFEKQLLASYLDHALLYHGRFNDSSKKRVVYSLHNQFMMGYTKVYQDFISEDIEKMSYSDNTDSITASTKPFYSIKISGIWETVDEIGITYKFIEMYQPK
jgi:hypothetical protein